MADHGLARYEAARSFIRATDRHRLYERLRSAGVPLVDDGTLSFLAFAVRDAERRLDDLGVSVRRSVNAHPERFRAYRETGVRR